MTAYCSRVLHVSKFVRPVRAEDEFELKENRIDFAIGEEEVRLRENRDCIAIGASRTRSDTRSDSRKCASAIADLDHR